jgi:hypothetical protein
MESVGGYIEVFQMGKGSFGRMSRIDREVVVDMDPHNGHYGVPSLLDLSRCMVW